MGNKGNIEKEARKEKEKNSTKRDSFYFQFTDESLEDDTGANVLVRERKNFKLLTSSLYVSIF